MVSRGIEQPTPGEYDAEDYLQLIENEERVLHLSLKDDREWWIAHTSEVESSGGLTGPWVFWTASASGTWERTAKTRQIAHQNIADLYYKDRYGNQAHTIHRAKIGPRENAPDFVRNDLAKE